MTPVNGAIFYANILLRKDFLEGGRIFSLGHLSVNNIILFCYSYLISGALYDFSQNYDILFYANGGLLLFTSVLFIPTMYWLHKKKTKRETLPKDS